MARITVDDCLDHIPNRFKLTLAATYRARELAQGHAARLETKDKPCVTALREISAGLTGVRPWHSAQRIHRGRFFISCPESR